MTVPPPHQSPLRRFLLNPILTAASFGYGVGLGCDRAFKSAQKVQLPKPVISVGNLTVGGTGKTPLLLKLAQDLLAMGIKPAILARGYRGFLAKGTAPRLIIGTHQPLQNDLSDEVRLMAEKLPEVPIGVGGKRLAMARQMMNSMPIEVFLLDDGFQHWVLGRDLDIVTIDVLDPWGGGSLLPRGRLREPWVGLKRARVIVLTRSELVREENLDEIRKKIGELGFDSLILTSSFHSSFWRWDGITLIPSSNIDPTNVLAVSGIGNPSGFERGLQQHHLDVFPVRFPDHHPYTDKDLRRLQRRSENERAAVVTTEKDFMKFKGNLTSLGEGFPYGLFVNKIELRFSAAEEEIWKGLLSKACLKKSNI